MDDAASTSNAGDGLRRAPSTASTKVADSSTLSRGGGTLKKRQSLRKRDSLRRSSSKRSLHAGSIKGVGQDDDDFDSVFSTPIPTSGNPTELLAERFQAWRKLLKDLITYFREIQSSYEHRSRALLKVSNVLNNTTAPPVFLSEGGLDDATRSLRAYHKLSVAEANKSKDIENDVITQLSGLRSDLTQKIKEIKSLSGDFKNSVDRERDNTRKAVSSLQDALAVAESDPSAANGKNDPFIVRLSVEKQVEKQIEEENYLHRAYLNLEGSGRELESIVVGEIQKAYNAYASIMKREADASTKTIDELRSGPIAMPKDREWQAFVQNEDQFVNPNVPLRSLEKIHYPGRFNPAASEIRAGMLERKSKYLKSYTPGWYVLSPTHLHEFKSADHIHTQQPVMSLCLLDQKLGSRSNRDASSHKFSLKGRQAGGMHRGHSWVFRAESFDTMIAWYEDIQNLTEKTGAEKSAFVRKHARSVSGGSRSAPSVSSDGMEDDEADTQPFVAAYREPQNEPKEQAPKRPEPGGRFPSDLNVNRVGSSQAPPSPSSESSDGRMKKVDTATQSKPPAAAARPPAESVAPAPAVIAGASNTQQADYATQPAPATVAAAQSRTQGEVAAPSAPQGQRQVDSGVIATAAVPAASQAQTQDRIETVQPASGPAPQDSNTVAALSGEVPPEVYEKEGAGVSGTVLPGPRGAGAATNAAPPTETDASKLHATGHIFPSVLRHESAMTVSDLHVPGEWATSAKATQG